MLLLVWPMQLVIISLQPQAWMPNTVWSLQRTITFEVPSENDGSETADEQHRGFASDRLRRDGRVSVVPARLL